MEIVDFPSLIAVIAVENFVNTRFPLITEDCAHGSLVIWRCDFGLSDLTVLVALSFLSGYSFIPFYVFICLLVPRVPSLIINK